MALKREYLKSMGLTDEQVSAIIDAHTDTVEALKSSATSTRRTPTSSPPSRRNWTTSKPGRTGSPNMTP